MFGSLQVLGAAVGLGPKNPKVPDLPRVDQQKVIGDTINSNIANLPGAEQLASSVNKFNQDEILKMLRAAIPGYDNITNQASGVIQSQLKGELPQDVQNLIQSKAAATAVGGGYGGSGMAGNLSLRNFGLSSLGETQKGLNSASQWLQTMRATATAPQFNVATMFDTPESALGREERYLENKFQRDWMHNQIKAQGSPLNQALWNHINQADSMGGLLGSSAMGSAVGSYAGAYGAQAGSQAAAGGGMSY